jgi:hypothetical protein
MKTIILPNVYDLATQQLKTAVLHSQIAINLSSEPLCCKEVYHDNFV